MHNIALIGCGKRGKQNAEAIQDDPRFTVTALVDPATEAAESLKAEYRFGDAVVYSDYRAMLDKQTPDLCIACIWTPLHLPVFRACAEAGVKAVFLEKPMAGRWDECREMARIAEETGCRLSFSHQRRFHEGNEAVRKLIASGVFGDIIQMDLFSVGWLLDCGTHTLDQASSYLGDSVGVKWVHGAIDISATHDVFGVPDGKMFTGTMMYDNGILANVHVGVQDHTPMTGVRILCTRGFIEVNWGGKVERHAVYDNPDWQPPTEVDDRGELMKRCFDDVVQALDSGTENALHYSKALRVSEVIFAFYESVRTHARVELPLTNVEGNPIQELLEKRG